jgi:hypothetical protein
MEQRIDAEVIARLSNAVATVGGHEFAVIFDRPYSGAFDGQVDAAAPECTGHAFDLAGLERGSAITINGYAYTVVRAEPDGAGLTRLTLATAE